MKGKWIYLSVFALLGILTTINPLVIFISIFFFLFVYKRKKFSRWELVIVCSIFVVFFIRSEASSLMNKTKLLADETDFSLYIDDDIKVDGDVFQVLAKEVNNHEKIIIRHKINSEKEQKLLKENVRIGMVCKVKGILEPPQPSSNENAFNYRQFLERNEIFWLLKLDSFNLSNCSPQKSTLLSYFRNIRQDGISYVMNHFPKESAPLAIALLFGERNFIDQDILRSYEKLGIVHLLAISGLHVGMLAGMIYSFGIRIGVTREKMTTVLMVFLPCYALLTGAAPSVIRAVFMMMIFLAVKKWSKRISPLLTIDVISLVFIAYTFYFPFIIYDVGFQLSFAVSFALILSAPILLQRFTHPLASLFSLSFICQLAAIPLLLYYFYEFSLISVFANVLFVPLFSVIILPAIFIFFLLHLLFGEMIIFLVKPLDDLIMLMDEFASKLVLLPFATITLGRPSMLSQLFFLLAIPLFFLLWEKNKHRKHFLKIFFILILVFFLHGSGNILSPYGEITFIDVGQGDSVFIKLPHGKGNYLIDTGGIVQFGMEEWKERRKQYEVGRDVVVPYLKSKGITKIHKLILTHGDLDHVGGAFEVMKELNVKELILPISADLSDLEKELFLFAKEEKIPVRFTKAGESWKNGNIRFQILSPETEKAASKNDGSIVLYAKIGGLNWLFTGDLEKEGEEKLIRKYHDLTIDVLKVGHHGSKTSTTEEFLDATNPKLAVISAGRKNRYNHPSELVLERLEKRNIKIFRTDQDGAITYTFIKERGTFSTHLP